MLKVLIGSVLAAVLVGTGILAGRATARGNETPARAESASPGCSEGRCDATIECKDGTCLIRWTAADGRTGEIELACEDGQCKVVRCDPCDQECKGGPCAPAAASGSCAPASCAPGSCSTPNAAVAPNCGK